MKLIPLTAIILIFASCATIGKKNILYGECKKGYFSCTQFELKKDKTFEYYIFMDIGGESILKGKWDFVNGDTIQLNTFKQPKIPKTYYEGKENKELTGRVRIQISDSDISLPFTRVEINDGEVKGSLDSNGIGYFDVDNIKNITYSYLGGQETITITNPKLNEIEVFVRDISYALAIPIYLTDELAVVTNKEIIMHPNQPESRYSIKRSRFGKKN